MKAIEMFSIIRDWSNGRFLKKDEVPEVGSVDIDDETIKKNAEDQLSVPALSRVFRARIDIFSENNARVVLPFKIRPIDDTTFGDLKVGDLFFCEVNPDNAAISCRPVNFSMIGTDKVDVQAALSTTLAISGHADPLWQTGQVPYISHVYTTASDFDNKNGFTILRYRGMNGAVPSFQDLLHGYTYTNIGNSLLNSDNHLATSTSVNHAFYNSLRWHYYYKGSFTAPETETILLYSGSQYLLAWRAFYTATDKNYGHGLRLISCNTLGTAPLQSNAAVSSNLGISLSGEGTDDGSWRLKLGAGATTLTVDYILYDIGAF